MRKNELLIITSAYLVVIPYPMTKPKQQISSLMFVLSSLVTEHRTSFGNIRMSDWFNRPVVIEQNDNFDDLTRGMGTQPELKSDEYHDSEVSVYTSMFKSHKFPAEFLSNYFSRVTNMFFFLYFSTY